jgi:ribosomal protein S18 acetylase RimI-like enzyme
VSIIETYRIRRGIAAGGFTRRGRSWPAFQAVRDASLKPGARSPIAARAETLAQRAVRHRNRTEWWEGAILKGSRISILAFGDTVAGYTNYGRNRARSLAYDGEICELYLCPEFQRRGFGRRLFEAVRRDLAQGGLKSLIVWALSDNTPAVAFFRALGGRPIARSSETFGNTSLDKIAYAWP